MVFSSLPLYLDPPNWQQHPNQQVLQGSAPGRNNNHDENQHLIHHPPPLLQPPGQSLLGMGGGGGGGPGGPAIRPNSMAERARLAKIPPPEAPLKCPRCESTNTKFCYFNNYSLSQPRHFCKTCRRYWTRGGALRSVPVGGGCRRNKRSSSKSSSGGGGGGGGGSSSKSSLTSPTALVGGDRIPLHMDLVTTSALIPTISGITSVGGGTGMSSFMASLQNLSQLGGMGNLGLSFGGTFNASPHPLGGLGVLTSGTHGGGGGGSGGDHHLGFPQLNPSATNPQVQFPNMWGGFEIPSSSINVGGAGLYTSTFPNDQDVGGENSDDQEHENNILPKSCSTDSNSQFAPIKTEVDGQGLNLHKQFMNMASSDNNNNASGNQFWAGSNIGNNATGVTSMWTDLSGLNSSSTSHLL